MQFRDLNAQYKKYSKEIQTAINGVLESGRFIGGDEVSKLEDELAEYIGVKHCISCANGTDALSLALMTWGIKEGDAVFVPDFTFCSTGEVVSLWGATPVFVDVRSDTFNIDVEKLEKAIQKTLFETKLIPKVIIPVDLFGLPADYNSIRKVADKYDMFVLEDGAQGLGGSIDGKKACSFGDISTTSFFPAKPLGCYGDGGAIFTDDDEYAQVINSLKVHGKGQNKYDNIRIGINSRLDSIQAAILRVKLKAFIGHELADVNKVADLYTSLLKDVVETPFIPNGYISSYAQYTIKLANKDCRDDLQSFLKRLDIPSMVYYVKPMHKQQAFEKNEYDDNDFDVTNKLCDTVLSLPMHPYLKEKDICFICDKVAKWKESIDD
jgi:UDP-2-acetamido-2-deoxy-ribo-hexuluronate aminotransferase